MGRKGPPSFPDAIEPSSSQDLFAGSFHSMASTIEGSLNAEIFNSSPGLSADW